MKEPSPQLENGYVKIANEIMDALCRFRMSGEVRQVVDCVLRKTYGWNKKEDWIAQSQIVEMTGLSKGSVSRELSKAITHKIVIVHDNQLKLNKNYKEWIGFIGKHFNPKPRGIKLSYTITNNEAKLSYPITEKKVIVHETKVIVHDGNKRHYTKDTTKEGEGREITPEFLERIKAKYPEFSLLRMDWELDRWKSWVSELPEKRKPKNSQASFRNWCFKSVEFKEERQPKIPERKIILMGSDP